MKTDNSKTSYMSVDDVLELSPRSRLYCLEPLGLGTGEVESATSYLARLAIAHTVSTWSLLKCEIAPRLFGPNVILRNRLSELTAAMGSACNGENQTSRKLISILLFLTGREDLDRITMGFCHRFVCSRFLVRVAQAWCSVCFSEWKAKGKEMYSPLLWHLMAVKMCPRHGIPLRTTCPACSRSFHPLTAHSRPGYCPRCGQWLGSAKSVAESAVPQATGDGETAKLISDFVRDGPGTLGATTTSAFPENIETLLQSHFGNNVQALSRYLRITRFTVMAWKNGVQHPTLLSLADVSNRVRVTPVDLLTTQLRADNFVLCGSMADQPSRKRFVSPPRVDLERMRQVLEEAVNGSSTHPSLSKLATLLGCNQSTLQRRFPELAEKVKQQYQSYCATQKEIRANLFRSKVRESVISIHKTGVYPSQSRIRQALPAFIDMREPVALDEWKRTLAELGFTYRERNRKAS